MCFLFFKRKIPKIRYKSNDDWNISRDNFRKKINEYIDTHFSLLGAYNGVYGPNELLCLTEFYESELNCLTKQKHYKWCRLCSKELYNLLKLSFLGINRMKQQGEYGDYPFDNWRWQEYKLFLTSIIINFEDYYVMGGEDGWLDQLPLLK